MDQEKVPQEVEITTKEQQEINTIKNTLFKDYKDIEKVDACLDLAIMSYFKLNKKSTEKELTEKEKEYKNNPTQYVRHFILYTTGYDFQEDKFLFSDKFENHIVLLDYKELLEKIESSEWVMTPESKKKLKINISTAKKIDKLIKKRRKIEEDKKIEGDKKIGYETDLGLINHCIAYKNGNIEEKEEVYNSNIKSLKLDKGISIKQLSEQEKKTRLKIKKASLEIEELSKKIKKLNPKLESFKNKLKESIQNSHKESDQNLDPMTIPINGNKRESVKVKKNPSAITNICRKLNPNRDRKISL